MKILIRQKVQAREWDTFVQESNNGTIFHTLTFQKYHKKGKFKFLNLAFIKDNKIIALLPGAIDGGTFFSPAGASYGSFVVKDIGLGEYEEIIDAFLFFAKKKAIRTIKLTPEPSIYSRKQNDIERFLLEYKNFKPAYHLISNAVNISQFKKKEEILESYTSMHKRATLKSFKKDVVVSESKNFDEFYTMLIENKKKFKTLPTHTLEEVKMLKKMFPDEIKLFMAHTKGKKPLAGILVFVANKKCALAFYICHYMELQEYRAVNRLFYEIMLWCKKKSIEWFDLGVSMDTSSKNPMEPSRSLIFFKEGIGSRGILRTTYVLSSKQ